MDMQNKRFRSEHDSPDVPLPAQPNPPISETVEQSGDVPCSNQTCNRDIEQLAESIAQHGPKYLSLKPAVRQWISKIHHNLGHPNCQKLKNVLSQRICP